MDARFWKGKRVLVTGHTGFKGGWLSLWLQKLGAEVFGYSMDPNTVPAMFDVAKVHYSMSSSHIGDIRDAAGLSCFLKEYQPEIVFHLAAQPIVLRSYAYPVETFSTNVMGIVHLMESIRACGSVKAVVNVTTDKCYEDRPNAGPYQETSPLGGYDPYSSSKACSEIVTMAYRRSFLAKAGTKVATARAGNVIGGGDWADNRLIPDMIRAFSAGKPVVIRNPNAIRPWQHVMEPLRGYLTLAERLCRDICVYEGAWNFGPNQDDSKPVGWVVDKLAKTWGDDATWEIEGSDHHESKTLTLDCSKAEYELGWKPYWNLETSLTRTVQWYKAHLRGEDMREVTLRQILDYSRQMGA